MKKYTSMLQVLALLALTLIQLPVQAVERTVYFHPDALGSTVAASDSSGALLWKEAYQPYGDRIRNEDDGNNVQWFSGKLQDEDTGLSYFGARYYDPTIGRFISVDPQRFDEGNLHSFNRYAYTNNNPYRYTDPNGESPLDFVFLAVDAVRLASAISSGEGIAGAVGDFAASLVGVISPVPGTGQAIKAANVASRAGKGLGAATKRGDTVFIGKLPDLKGVPPDKTLLPELPNLGSAKANFKQNSSVLRRKLREGKTIQDKSFFRRNSDIDPSNPNKTVGQSFLGAERLILNNKGLAPDANGIFRPK